MGTTITNILIVALLFGFSHLSGGLGIQRTLKKASALVLIYSALVYIYAFALNSIYARNQELSLGDLFSSQNLVGTLCFLLMLGGALRLRSLGKSWRMLGTASLAVLLYNGVFHAIWGSEYMLYSQHFQLAAPLAMLKRLSPVGTACFGALLVMVAINNYARFDHMLERMEEVNPVVQAVRPTPGPK
jgi:fucose 4-O-acetylase-like acetyltransferase